MTPSSLFESLEVSSTENTPLGLSFGTPVPQGKKKSPRSLSSKVFVTLASVCLGMLVAYTYLSPLASSLVNQSLFKSANKNVYENNIDVFPTSSLIESVTKIDTSAAEITKVAKGMADLNADPQFSPLLPVGVFDKANRNDAVYLQGIHNRCQKLQDASNVNQVLACQIYFDNTDFGTVQQALGTIRTDANLVKIISTGVVEASDVSSLFQDYALATMINSGCFSWDTETNTYLESQVQYNGEQSYSTNLEQDHSLDISGSVGYGPLTVNAGYKGSSTHSSSTSSTTKTAYGMNLYRSPVGVLKNTCFDDKTIFRDQIFDLVTRDVVARWDRIRNVCTSIEKCLAIGDDFIKMADGGFFMPLHYHYDEGITSTLTATYSSSNTTQSTAATSAISAGLAVSDFGAKASIKASVHKGIKKNTEASSYAGTVGVTIKETGNGIDSSCLKSGAKVACNTMIEGAVESVRADLNNLGTPTSQSQFITLDTIIKWYFNDNVGLPDAFQQAVLYKTKGTCWKFTGIGMLTLSGAVEKQIKLNEKCWVPDSVTRKYDYLFYNLIPGWNTYSDGNFSPDSNEYCGNQCCNSPGNFFEDAPFLPDCSDLNGSITNNPVTLPEEYTTKVPRSF